MAQYLKVDRTSSSTDYYSSASDADYLDRLTRHFSRSELLQCWQLSFCTAPKLSFAQIQWYSTITTDSSSKQALYRFLVQVYVNSALLWIQHAIYTEVQIEHLSYLEFQFFWSPSIFILWDYLKLQKWFNINNIVLIAAPIIIDVNQSMTHLQVILAGTNHCQTTLATLPGWHYCL
jgi:hypothetical protein